MMLKNDEGNKQHQFVTIATGSRHHLDEKSQNSSTIKQEIIQDSKMMTTAVHKKKNKKVTTSGSSTSTTSSTFNNLTKEQEEQVKQQDLNKKNDSGCPKTESRGSDHITAATSSSITASSTTNSNKNVREEDDPTLLVQHPGVEFNDYYATYEYRTATKNSSEEVEKDCRDQTKKRREKELGGLESRGLLTAPWHHHLTDTSTVMEGRTIDTSSPLPAYGGKKVNIKSNGGDEKGRHTSTRNKISRKKNDRRVAVVVANEDDEDDHYYPSSILEDDDVFSSRKKRRMIDCTSADSSTKSFVPKKKTTAATSTANEDGSSSSKDRLHEGQGKQKESDKDDMVSKRKSDDATAIAGGVMKISKKHNHGSNPLVASSSFDHTSITSDSDNNEDGTPASIPPIFKDYDHLPFGDPHDGSSSNQRNSSNQHDDVVTSMIGGAGTNGADDEDNLMSWWQRQQRPLDASNAARGGSTSSDIERQPSVDSSSRSHSAILAAQREFVRRTNRTMNVKSDDEEVVLQESLHVPPPASSATSQMVGYPQYQHNHYYPPHHPQAQPPSFSHHPAQYHHHRGNSFHNDDLLYAVQADDGGANVPGAQPTCRRNQTGTQQQVRGRNEHEFSQLPALPHESHYHDNQDLYHPHPHHDPYNVVNNRALARRSHESLSLQQAGDYPSHEYDQHGNYIVPPPVGGSSYPHGDGSSHSSVAQMSGSSHQYQRRPPVPPHDNNDSARIDQRRHHHHHHQEDNYHQQMPALQDHNHLQQHHHYAPPHFPNAPGGGHNYPPAPPAQHLYQDAIPVGGGQLLPYYSRRVLPLATSDDENWLSEFLCFVRSECVEVFKATPEDVAARMNSKKVLPGQVGIRCRFCAHLPHRERTGRSSSFPSSINRIYQSLTMMLRDHFTKCTAMPPDMRDRYLSLKANASQGATDSKRYWIDSGMYCFFEMFCLVWNSF